MTLDARLRPLARDLFEHWGKEITFRREVPGEFDPATGEITGGSTTDYTVIATPPAAYRQDYIDGTLIQQNDFQISIAAQTLPVEPTLTDKVIVDEITFQIASVHPVYSGELAAMYTLQVRQ